MQQTMADRRTVWVKEATHRAAISELVASNLQWLIDHGKFVSRQCSRNDQASQRAGEDLSQPTHTGLQGAVPLCP